MPRYCRVTLRPSYGPRSGPSRSLHQALTLTLTLTPNLTLTLTLTLTRPWLASTCAAHFVACAVWGHHLTCHYHLLGHRRRGRANGTALQNHLLQTAVLQVQSSAIPVAAHALGLVPASLAASCTALPLCSTAPQAAAYCALFLAVNGWNLVHARSRSARARPGLAAPSA